MAQQFFIKFHDTKAGITSLVATPGGINKFTVPADVNIELVDGRTGRAPASVKANRKGKDLVIRIDDDTGLSGGITEIVLEDYYPQVGCQLAGLDDQGQYLQYTPSDRDEASSIAILVDGDPTTLALSGAPIDMDVFPGACAAPISMNALAGGVGGATVSPLVLGALGLGAAAIAIGASGGGHGDKDVATDVQKDHVPATPIHAPTSYRDNAGAVQSENSTAPLTDDNTPGLHVGALPSDATGAVLYVDGVLIPSTYDPTTGTLTPVAPLPDGSHELGYGWSNKTGVTPPSPTLKVDVDSTAPEMPGKFQVADTDFDGKPNISGTGEPNGLVIITDPTGTKHTTTVDPSGHFELEIDMPSKPTGEWTATVTDPAGNVSPPASLTLTDAPVAPPVIASATDKVESVVGPIPNHGYTNDPQPTLTGTATPGTLVTVFDGAKVLGSVVADKAGSWTIKPSSSMGEGDHVLTAKSTRGGLVTLGDQAIAITSIVSDTGASASDFITSATSVTAYGTGVANAWIQVFLDGRYLGNQQIDGGGNWSYGLSTPQGNHTIKAHYIDLAENVVPGPVAERGMTVDTTAPVFTTPANSNVNENTAAGTVIYNAATSDATGVTYAITGGADAARFSINASTGQVTMNFAPDYEAPIDAGGNNVYDYVITATDTAGNQSTQNASLTVLDVAEAPSLKVTDNVGSGIWVMSGGYGGTYMQYFVMGKLNSDVPVTYTTNVDWIKVRADGVIYTDGNGHPDKYYVVNNHFAVHLVSDRVDEVTITAHSAGGDTSIKLDVTYYYNLNNPGAPYPTYSAAYHSSFVPPVALDLNHDNEIKYSNAGVDVNGDGHTHTSAWVGAQDGVLVWDKYGDGKVHDSSQYAFAQYLLGAKTDLEGLKAFDTNGNGRLDRGDAIWNEMRVWQDLNGDGASDAGEVKTLAEWGITSVGLTSDGVVATPAQGVAESGKASASLADGSQMLVADVAFDTRSAVAENGVVARPFVLDLNHDGAISYGKGLIDVDGAGQKGLVVGISKGDGVLVWNKYSDGQVHDASQYSFNSLKIFDTNGDSKLDSRDVLWKQLSVWQDVNGDGVSEAGEVKTLSELGFKEINFVSDGVIAKPAAGVIEYGKASVTMNDGSAMVAAQASFSLLDQSQWTPTASAVI